MNIYENIVILNASLPDEEITAAINRIKDLIVNAGGEPLKTELWGRRKLTYEIKKQNKGYYVLFIFKTPAATIKKLEEFYKVFDAVIKFMVIKLGPKQVKHLEAAQAAEAAAEAAKAEQAKTEPSRSEP
ncbi:MAG: 30S ribosomal protein S6 [Nitrospirae bacterium]|nr:30S ribosomal protein S6 [Nitrospirota bacterium]